MALSAMFKVSRLDNLIADGMKKSFVLDNLQSVITYLYMSQK